MAANSQPTVAAILVAAGSGERLGAGLPKAFVSIGGTTLLELAAARFAGHPDVGAVIVVAPRSHVERATQLVPEAQVVVGGDVRQASVAAGLALVAPEVEFVLVHDVARPL